MKLEFYKSIKYLLRYEPSKTLDWSEINQTVVLPTYLPL